jgi:hypothetical protein
MNPEQRSQPPTPEDTPRQAEMSELQKMDARRKAPPEIVGKAVALQREKAQQSYKEVARTMDWEDLDLGTGEAGRLNRELRMLKGTEAALRQWAGTRRAAAERGDEAGANEPFQDFVGRLSESDQLTEHLALQFAEAELWFGDKSPKASYDNTANYEQFMDQAFGWDTAGGPARPQPTDRGPESPPPDRGPGLAGRLEEYERKYRARPQPEAQPPGPDQPSDGPTPAPEARESRLGQIRARLNRITGGKPKGRHQRKSPE